MSLSQERIKEIVFNVLAEKLGVARDKLSEDVSLVDDLGADSLDQVEAVMGVEDALAEEAGVHWEDVEIKNLEPKTVREVIGLAEGALVNI